MCCCEKKWCYVPGLRSYCNMLNKINLEMKQLKELSIKCNCIVINDMIMQLYIILSIKVLMRII